MENRVRKKKIERGKKREEKIDIEAFSCYCRRPDAAIV
jgi:hypothetical protein